MSGERKIIKGEGGKKRKEQREFREAGETKKKKKTVPILGEITVPDLVTGSQCADVTMYKRSQSPMISNSLTTGARASPWSGQVGER